MFYNSRFSIARIANSATRRAVSVLTLALAATFASGCSLLSDNLDKAAKGAGKVVSEYCANITVEEVRAEVAAAINKHAAPNSVTITCADGGPVLKTSGEVTP